MMILLAEIREGLEMPDFGPEYRRHMDEKRHPGHKKASICAWLLLEAGLKRMGCAKMPEVTFLEGGKPVFRDGKKHFSLSHSSRLAAVIISDGNCAVDVEIIDRKAEEKLKNRCMHANEIASGMDFFECWTKKECLGKLSGRGISIRPCEIDLTAEKTAFFTRTVCDSEGKTYFLSAAGEKLPDKIEWMEI